MTQVTAKEIHADFYGAEERLYVEAVGLSSGSLVTKSTKAERLKKIGFGKAAPIKKCEEQEKKRAVSGHMISVIEYFRTYYPQNKFITEAEVKTLCEKYGLLLGEASNYIGDMPEKNLCDIERFKLRKEDWKEKTYFAWRSMPITADPIEGRDEYGLIFSKPRQSGRRDMYDSLLYQYFLAKDQMAEQLGIPKSRERWAIGADPYETEKKKEYEQPAFKICAPKQDFNTIGWEVRDGYKLVYDPIVLQPVSKEGIEGYLIITMWGGPETEDELVVDQNKN